MFDDGFNDDYVTPTDPLLGEPWTYLQPDKGVLQTRRQELGMTQQEVADKAKIKLRQYQRFEKGERDMSAASMRIGLSICAVLRLDPYRFYPKSLLNLEEK